ncbi:MAG: Crp/Fnr family transcriptional regulator [Ruminococcaceae bacterium]|nr:Crp/Fnr family transcriptional regulator [Oscillospiraceae bacterium]
MDIVKNSVLKRSCLFSALCEDGLDHALDFFKATQKSYAKGQIFISPEDNLKSFGLVLSGTVQIYTLDIDGSQMIMATVLPGETFGESLSYLKRKSEIFATALTDTDILWLSPERIQDGNLTGNREKELLNRFISLLANRALTMNDRIQILSKLSIREKLIAFFTESVRKYKSYNFALPFDRADMAIYLGCDRSALSRELSKMNAEGLITFSGKNFTVNIQKIL